MWGRQVGIIDVGSNTIKLLIAEQADDGTVRSVRFEVEETRIGEGLTGTPPLIDPEAISRGTQAIGRLHRLAAQHDLHCLRIVATSAVRDASNRAAFIDSVASETGIELETLSGNEEARLIGKGLQCDPKLSHLSSYALLDLGGGSMECILFSEGAVSQIGSLDLGAVRLSSKYVPDRHRPLARHESDSIRDHVEDVFVSAHISRASAPSPVAVLTGGTASILAARSLASTEVFSAEQARAFRDEVCRLSRSERVSQLNIPESRADIFPAAITILCAALDYLGCDQVHFSEYNLRYGLAAEMIEQL